MSTFRGSLCDTPGTVGVSLNESGKVLKATRDPGVLARSWYLTVKSPRNGRPYLRYFSPRKQGLAGPGFEAGGVGCLPCDVLFETGCLSACESGELLLDLGDASLHCDGFEGGLVGG